jgi:hypothetical protein
MPKLAPIGPYGQNQALRTHAFGQKTARKRPKRDRIGITATSLGLEQDPRRHEAEARAAWNSPRQLVERLAVADSFFMHAP